MVQIIRKAPLPKPAEVIESARRAAERAHTLVLREPRPAGFPLLFTRQWQLIEPVVTFLHEHSVQRAHTADTLRTYAEILYDWFDTLEQNAIQWDSADAVDLVAYRNRMLKEPSPHTHRPYRTTTVNHRVRGVLRFYEWAVRTNWLRSSPLATKPQDFAIARRRRAVHAVTSFGHERSLFVLRQYEALPRPLMAEQSRELLATLAPPYDLMARWQLYTGLRVSELLRLSPSDIANRQTPPGSLHTVEISRKGRKPGYVITPASLLDETQGYVSGLRHAWLERARRAGRAHHHTSLFINPRGAPAGKNAYQRSVSRAAAALGFKATTHLLRATFACMLLARLEHLANQGAMVNPLLVVKILMGHEHIESTDRYLRAIAVDACVLKEVLDTLLSQVQEP